MLGHLAGGAQADAEEGRQGAAAHAALLAAAVHQRLDADARAAAHIEGANALGPVDLVAADGHEVDVGGVDVDGDLADGLRGVRVEEDTSLAADAADRRDGLDHANLVVDRHDRDERRLGRDLRLELLRKKKKKRQRKRKRKRKKLVKPKK